MWCLPLFVPHLFMGDNLEQKRDIALKTLELKPGEPELFLGN